MNTLTKCALGAGAIYLIHQIGVATGFAYMNKAMNTPPEERTGLQQCLVDTVDKERIVVM